MVQLTDKKIILPFFCFYCFFIGCTQKLFVSYPLTKANGFVSPEGPAVDKNGFLYVVNYQRKGSIALVKPKDTPILFIILPHGSVGNGIRINKKGKMFIADYVHHNIYEVDLETKKLDLLVHQPLWKQPNDLAIDGNGRLYASDPDWKQKKGCIWRIDPNGKTVLIDSSLGTVNGIEVNYNDDKLYVNETNEGNVWQYDLSTDGLLSNKHLLIHFDDFLIDGMRSDVKDNLYISRYGKGTIVKVSPQGNILTEIKLNGLNVTNLAFGGTDGRTVYVTVKDNGNIESFRTDTPGTEWMKHKK